MAFQISEDETQRNKMDIHGTSTQTFVQQFIAATSLLFILDNMKVSWPSTIFNNMKIICQHQFYIFSPHQNSYHCNEYQ